MAQKTFKRLCRDGSEEPPSAVCNGESLVLVVSVLAFKKDGTIVLVSESANGTKPEDREWLLPGGPVNNGESIKEAAIRYCREEAELKVEPTGIITVENYPKLRQNWIRLAVRAEVTGTCPHPHRAYQKGRYTLTRPVSLRKGMAVSTKKLQSLAKGSTVDVVQLATDPATRAVRARISEPAGWISLQSSTGLVTAAMELAPKPVSVASQMSSKDQDILKEMMEKMKKHNALKGSPAASKPIKIEFMNNKSVEKKSPQQEGDDATETQVSWMAVKKAEERASTYAGIFEALGKGQQPMPLPSRAGPNPFVTVQALVCQREHGVVLVLEDEEERKQQCEKASQGGEAAKKTQLRWSLPRTHVEGGDTLSFALSRLLRALMGFMLGDVQGVIALEHTACAEDGAGGIQLTLLCTLETPKALEEFKEEAPKHRWVRSGEIEDAAKQGIVSPWLEAALGRALKMKDLELAKLVQIHNG